MIAKELYKIARAFLFAFLVVMKQYLVNLARFHVTLDVSKSRFLEPISFSRKPPNNSFLRSKSTKEEARNQKITRTVLYVATTCQGLYRLYNFLYRPRPRELIAKSQVLVACKKLASHVVVFKRVVFQIKEAPRICHKVFWPTKFFTHCTG